MEWKTIPDRYRVRDYVPLDKQFLVLWKGIISICEFDEDDDAFWICYLPAQYGAWKLALEREAKITHWCELELPKDY